MNSVKEAIEYLNERGYECIKRVTGYEIRKLREHLSETMEEFGKRLSPEASKGAVSNWENGYCNPNKKRLAQIYEIALASGFIIEDMEIEELERDIRRFSSKKLVEELNRRSK